MVNVSNVHSNANNLFCIINTPETYLLFSLFSFVINEIVLYSVLKKKKIACIVEE